MGNWNITVNVAGVQPFEPGAFARIPEGAYAVQIVDTELTQKDPSKAASLSFDVKVLDAGPAQGMTGKVFVGTDLTKDGNKRHIRGLLLGVGATVAALDAGNVNLSADMFVGKQAYMFVETREGKDDNGKPLYDNRNFIAPAYYEKKKAEAAQKTTGLIPGTAPAGIAGLAAGQGAPAPAAAFAGGALFGR